MGSREGAGGPLSLSCTHRTAINGRALLDYLVILPLWPLQKVFPYDMFSNALFYVSPTTSFKNLFHSLDLPDRKAVLIYNSKFPFHNINPLLLALAPLIHPKRLLSLLGDTCRPLFNQTVYQKWAKFICLFFGLVPTKSGTSSTKGVILN